MTDAEVKLELFRLIDHKKGSELKELYNNVISLFSKLKTKEKSLEEQYKIMSQDTKREKDAQGWIEGTLNHETL